MVVRVIRSDASTAVTALSMALSLTVAALGWLARRLAPRARQIGHLLDDFTGEPPRPGLPDGRPGVMARMARIEEHLSRLDVIDAHLGINSIPAQRKSP